MDHAAILQTSWRVVQKTRAVPQPERQWKQTGEKPVAVLGIFGGTEYECKNCRNNVNYMDEYCRWCGQKLDWEDEMENEIKEYCSTCKYYAGHEGICCNWKSEYRADFRTPDDTCEKWKENEE